MVVKEDDPFYLLLQLPFHILCADCFLNCPEQIIITPIMGIAAFLRLFCIAAPIPKLPVLYAVQVYFCTTLATPNHACVSAGIPFLMTLVLSTLHPHCLRCREGLRIDDGFMVIVHPVHRNLSVVQL